MSKAESWTKIVKEQEFQRKKFAAVDQLARECGFDDDAFAYTEFCLMPFFERVVEECAKVVEQKTGCRHSAEAVQNYSKMIGNE